MNFVMFIENLASNGTASQSVIKYVLIVLWVINQMLREKLHSAEMQMMFDLL